MNAESKHQSYGWLLVNLAAVIVIGAVGWHMTKPRDYRCGGRITCVNNEKQLGIAFRGFGIDIGGFPVLISNINSTANTQELVDVRSTHFEEQ